jgi:hypothetical protein
MNAAELKTFVTSYTASMSFMGDEYAKDFQNYLFNAAGDWNLYVKQDTAGRIDM